MLTQLSEDSHAVVDDIDTSCVGRDFPARKLGQLQEVNTFMSQFMSKNDGTGTSHCLQQLGAGVGPSACYWVGFLSLVAHRPRLLERLHNADAEDVFLSLESRWWSTHQNCALAARPRCSEKGDKCVSGIVTVTCTLFQSALGCTARSCRTASHGIFLTCPSVVHFAWISWFSLSVHVWRQSAETKGKNTQCISEEMAAMLHAFSSSCTRDIFRSD